MFLYVHDDRHGCGPCEKYDPRVHILHNLLQYSLQKIIYSLLHILYNLFPYSLQQIIYFWGHIFTTHTLPQSSYSLQRIPIFFKRFKVRIIFFKSPCLLIKSLTNLSLVTSAYIYIYNLYIYIIYIYIY